MIVYLVRSEHFSSNTQKIFFTNEIFSELLLYDINLCQTFLYHSLDTKSNTKVKPRNRDLEGTISACVFTNLKQIDLDISNICWRT